MSLYDEEVSNIINRIKDSIREHDMSEEDKINSKVIKEAIVQIKANKTDALLPVPAHVCLSFDSSFLMHILFSGSLSMLAQLSLSLAQLSPSLFCLQSNLRMQSYCCRYPDCWRIWCPHIYRGVPAWDWADLHTG